MTETFDFAPAVRTCTPMVIAIAGPSGSGKTYTAIELAMGLAGDGKIALIDTEGRRGLHYADLKANDGKPKFRFDHCDFRSPYEPRRFLQALKTAEAAEYAVIVTDSFSDEYVGEGGLVDMAAASTVSNDAAKWAKPKAEHKLVIRWLRQSRCHLIFCIRAEEKVKLEKVYNEHRRREEVVVVPVGWQPICEKNTMYDMTASFMLHPDAPGIPHAIKLQEQHRQFFPEGKTITRDAGRLLAEWCAGGAPAPIGGTIYRDGQMAALRGRGEFRKWWREQGRNTNALTDQQVDALQQAARLADAEGDPLQPVSTPSPSQIREPAASGDLASAVDQYQHARREKPEC